MKLAAKAGLTLAFLGLASPGKAQAVAELAGRCTAASGGAGWCAAGALAYQAVVAGVGLAASAGSDIPGTSSTLGWRRGLGPRLALSARATGARISLPELSAATATRLPELRSRVSGASLEGVAGLFDGFRASPLHGGILALDVVASVGVLALPAEDGFQGNPFSAGIGVRLGILRESFDVPGVSISAVRRFFGETRLGAAGAPATLRLEPAATSLRALIGKDFSVAGVVAGAGWDRYSGDVTLDGAASPGGRSASASLSGPAVDRLLFFGGISRTWLVVQLAAEVGWATGLDDLPDPATKPFDPGTGSVFGSLSLRMTL